MGIKPTLNLTLHSVFFPQVSLFSESEIGYTGEVTSEMDLEIESEKYGVSLSVEPAMMYDKAADKQSVTLYIDLETDIRDKQTKSLKNSKLYYIESTIKTENCSGFNDPFVYIRPPCKVINTWNVDNKTDFGFFYKIGEVNFQTGVLGDDLKNIATFEILKNGIWLDYILTVGENEVTFLKLPYMNWQAVTTQLSRTWSALTGWAHLELIGTELSELLTKENCLALRDVMNAVEFPNFLRDVLAETMNLAREIFKSVKTVKVTPEGRRIIDHFKQERLIRLRHYQQSMQNFNESLTASVDDLSNSFDGLVNGFTNLGSTVAEKYQTKQEQLITHLKGMKEEARSFKTNVRDRAQVMKETAKNVMEKLNERRENTLDKLGHARREGLKLATKGRKQIGLAMARLDIKKQFDKNMELVDQIRNSEDFQQVKKKFAETMQSVVDKYGLMIKDVEQFSEEQFLRNFLDEQSEK